jgi:glycerol-3-phosphate dehydrogenase
VLWQAKGVPARPQDNVGRFDRHRALARLADDRFDVLVVGGGVTGAGVALDAAARGLRTALVERHDFASGTSSKSSKMVHGGLRYLQQGDIRLVYEALHERQRLLNNAPHLVQPLPFLIPLFGRNGAVSSGVARAVGSALWLYDLTGGWRIGRRHRRVSAGEALAHLPTLRTDRLVAGFLYFDARVDDARLTLTLARTAAVDFGAVVANYTEVVALSRDDTGTVAGALVRPCGPGDTADAGPFEVQAKVVVNATGVWADDIRALDEGTHPRTTRPAKGVHITVPGHRLPADIAAVLPVPGDRRSIFVVPWGDSNDTYIGTTDTAWDGSLDAPECSAEDVDYLLDAVNAATTATISRSDVTGVWAGLRPLLAPQPTHQPQHQPDSGSPTSGLHRWTAVFSSGVFTGIRAAGSRRRTDPTRRPSDRTTDLSRRHRVMTSKAGVVTVTGGKLTTYRLMAEDTVDAVVRQLGPEAPPGARRSPTRRLALRGSPNGGRSPARTVVAPGSSTAARTGRLPATSPDPLADPTVSAALEARYGTEGVDVLALAGGQPELLTSLVPGLPYLRVEVLWAAQHEMAQTVDDVLSRRMRVTLRRAHDAAAVAEEVAELLAAATGRPADALAGETSAFTSGVLAELAQAGIPTGDTAVPATHLDHATADRNHADAHRDSAGTSDPVGSYGPAAVMASDTQGQTSSDTPSDMPSETPGRAGDGGAGR